MSNLFSTDGARVLGDARLAPQGSLTDPDLSRRLAHYKRAVASRYKAVLPQELAEAVPRGAMHVSPKIDGELWYLVIDDGEVFLASPTGRVLTGDVPLLADARKNVVPRVKGRTVLAGELWGARREGRPRSRDVAMALGGEGDLSRLAWTGFDVVLVGDEEHGTPREYQERLDLIQSLVEGGKRVRAVKTEVVQAPGDAARLYGEWCEGGKAEGLVIRGADGRVYKVKPAFHLDVAVVGYTVRTEDAHQARTLLGAVMRQDGSFQIVGSIGNLGNDDARRDLLTRVQGTEAPSRYRYASRTGALFQFVEPRMVIEIAVTDIQSEDANGRALPRMVLDHDADQGWRAVRPMPGVTLFAPRLTRIRDDKAVNPVDVRASQVLERVALDKLESHAERVDLPASEVVRREVWTKETKGKLAVRKLVVWKTHKEEVDAEWPAFVVHWTDYSPGRKEPLQREVRLAPDAESADAIAEEMIGKGVKRGWKPVEEDA